MRTEYTIRITDKKGKVSTSVYPKKYADKKAINCKEFYEPKGCKVEYFKVMWNGASFYKAEKIF